MATRIDERIQKETNRILSHPILPPPQAPTVPFTFDGKELLARPGGMISSALYANGIHIFGHHPRDGAPQGIFCANGTCSQCLVIADGLPVKACMAPVKPGMRVYPLDSYPELPEVEGELPYKGIERIDVDALVVGAGPAGMSAAIELGRLGIRTLIVDDKAEVGGKLTLQTHAFFGSVRDCFAGTRGIDIARILEERLSEFGCIEVWLAACAVGAFYDRYVGIARESDYLLVRPKALLVAAGAREKMLAFPGSDLPGVYGAGAFQTLVNRDLVRPAERLFVVGGGNVGLIGAYHALQAGIEVVGLVEVLPYCGGYKVHEDKLKRLGVPIWTSHTVVAAEGKEGVERVVIAQIDKDFRAIEGTQHAYSVDTVLIAVGLAPVNELAQKAAEYGIAVYSAGDAEEIAEASAAMFSGKIAGREVAHDLGVKVPIPQEWEETGDILKSKPGETREWELPDTELPVFPIIRCTQEIPCDPCTKVCPRSSIRLSGDSIMDLPSFAGDCTGCARCILSCPGLAIILYIGDYDPKGEKVGLIMPWELAPDLLRAGGQVVTVDADGNEVGRGKVVAFKNAPSQDRRQLVLVEVPAQDGLKVAGFRPEAKAAVGSPAVMPTDDDYVICLCERVHKRKIVEAIRAGVRDMNHLKAELRTGLGACGGKTCTDLILRIFAQEGIPLSEITPPTVRPFVSEIRLAMLAGAQEDAEPEDTTNA
jgi:sarcosine oxidase subunit alpha